MSRSTFTTRMFCSIVTATHGLLGRTARLEQLGDDGEPLGGDLVLEVFAEPGPNGHPFEVGQTYDVTFTPAA